MVVQLTHMVDLTKLGVDMLKRASLTRLRTSKEECAWGGCVRMVSEQGRGGSSRPSEASGFACRYPVGGWLQVFLEYTGAAPGESARVERCQP